LGEGGGKGGDGGGPPILKSIDTRLIGKSKDFNGRDESWPRFFMALRAYVAATKPALPLPLRRAEEGDVFSNDDLDPESELRSMQLFYIPTMLVEGLTQDKVRLAGDNEGANLRQLLWREHEPRTACRRAVLIQMVFGFTWNAGILKCMGDFDLLVRSHEHTVG